MKIVVDDLSGPEIAAFLDEHIREMRAVTPAGSKHALDLEGLRRPEVTFWTALDVDTVVGCGALKELDSRHGEIKSMRVASVRKRSGVASTLLEHIISAASSRGYHRLSLETGSFEFFAPARALYRKFGFKECEPFADYAANPHSVYMTKML